MDFWQCLSSERGRLARKLMKQAGEPPALLAHFNRFRSAALAFIKFRLRKLRRDKPARLEWRAHHAPALASGKKWHHFVKVSFNPQSSVEGKMGS